MPLYSPEVPRRPGSVARLGGKTGEQRSFHAIVVVFVLLFLALWPGVAGADITGQLRVSPGPDLSSLQNRTVDAVRVRNLGELWEEERNVRSVAPGDVLSGALVRRALRELDRTGEYAELRAEVQEIGGRLVLTIWVRPRKLLSQIRLKGGVLSEADERRALGLTVGDGVTDVDLERARQGLTRLYETSGYSRAEVLIVPEAVDDPRRVLLRISIVPGPPQAIRRVAFRVSPSPHHPALGASLDKYALGPGDRLDTQAISQANQSLLDVLVQARFYEATVEHVVRGNGVLEVRVKSGPRFDVRIEGNEVFGTAELSAQLGLEKERDPRPDLLKTSLEAFYTKHGFLDAYVRAERYDDEAGLRSELYVWIREGERFRIVERVFPCLSGSRTDKDLKEEIEGVLSEQFPVVAVFHAPSAGIVDAATGSPGPLPRPTSYQGQPWTSFTQKSHVAVMEHLRDLYRSEGYLDAEVGPATVVRRQCLPNSPPGECRVEGERSLPETSCSGAPEATDEVVETCVPDRAAGIRCEAEGVLVLPIHAGPQAILYDLVLEGNEAFSERELLKVAALDIGKPLRRAELEGALRRIQEKYQEEAYAFAQIDSEIELSADHTRARLVISVTERQRVHVSRIEVRGATDTREGLIRSRLALKVGRLYRRSWIRRSQEQLESLGVFTSVTVALEDPGVPAREKVVVVTLAERLPQYLDMKGGFGSVDGFRIGFEYGHRNLVGEAIQFTLRSQLALRPPFLIAEKDVRLKYEQLSDLERLERRNTLTWAFPEIGLGPSFRFEVELLDLLDNARDFTHTRDASLVRLLFRPRRQFLFTVGGTIEINEAMILGGESLLDYARDNPAQNIRIPEGRSIAYTQNFNASWDARDKPLAATRGAFLGLGVEHVTAVPLGGEIEGTCNQGSNEVFDPVCSELLRFTGRVAGYIPVSRSGLTFAMSFRAGMIQHLTDISRTYPDRLFFMGGVDTLRGYPQFSLVPQDLAESVLDRDDDRTIKEVVLRGGDVFINPRAELRIPLGGSVQTALFLDAGNLWADRSEFDPTVLRYTAGSGLRIETPVGPLVFDYGFNLERLVHVLGRESSTQREWEDIGAFHFSIGLF